MGRLSALKPQLSRQAPMIARQTDAEGHSRALEPLRHLYGTARWKRLRIRVFVRDYFTCQWPGCGRVEGNTSLLTCDHVKPHRGDERRFWDETNLETLCKPCHDGPKQLAERRAEGVGGGSKSGKPHR